MNTTTNAAPALDLAAVTAHLIVLAEETAENATTAEEFGASITAASLRDHYADILAAIAAVNKLLA